MHYTSRIYSIGRPRGSDRVSFDHTPGRMSYLWISVLIIVGVSCDEFHDEPQQLLLTAAGAQDLPKEVKRDWMDLGKKELDAALALQRNMGVAKNVILFIGDGMGVSTISAARVFNMHQMGRSFEESSMSWEKFPHVGLSKTYNTDRYVPDSAGTATAFLTGNKAPYGTIGIDQHAVRSNCSSVPGREVKSFLKLGHEKGKWAGLVTSTRVTHATPAAAYAHSADRNWEARSPDPSCRDIARQLVEENSYLRVILGGARLAFLPANTSDPEYPDQPRNPNSGSVRADNMDLIELWHTDKNTSKRLSAETFKYVQNQTQFTNVDPTKVDYLLGLFEPFHMQYEADRAGDPWGEPSLAEMTRKAIQILKRGDKGFALLVEGGRIDHAHHDNMAYKSLYDVLALSEAVQAAVNETDASDTLIVVSADHSHVFTMGGYAAWNDHIMGFPNAFGKAGDGKPYTVLGYTNGPGWTSNNNQTGAGNSTAGIKDRNVLTEEQTKDKNYLQDAAIPLNSETHGGEDVGVYASGPMAHLFHGTHEQSYIAHVIMYASCVGPYNQHCQGGPKVPPDCPTPPTGGSAKLSVMSLFMFMLCFLAKLISL